MNKSILLLLACTLLMGVSLSAKEPVEYVNPKMGSISHLLVPGKETIQLPNSMMRSFAGKFDGAAISFNSLPFYIHTHRFSPNLKLNVYTSDSPKSQYIFDKEKVTPYSYSVFLEDDLISVDYAVSSKSAIYEFDFSQSGNINSRKIEMASGNFGEIYNDGYGYGISHKLRNNTKIYIYIEFDKSVKNAKEGKSKYTLEFDEDIKNLKAKYAVSFISFKQAKTNLGKDIKDFDIKKVKENGKAIWNKALGQIDIDSSDENAKAIFYTSFWRTFERMVNYDEDGKFYNVYKGFVSDSLEGKYIYIDDWSWDTYRTSHPLRLLLSPSFEVKCLKSILFFGQSHPKKWVPKFPTIDGDNTYMNGNHIVASFLDAYRKGVKDLDLKGIYDLALNTTLTKSILPDTILDAGSLTKFYHENGYIPALKKGEKEYAEDVNPRMRRQSVSTTTATAYDDWCLAQIAEIIGDKEGAKNLNKNGFNYRKLFNQKTKFFHPKDKDGNFLPNINYSTSGGVGFRDFYTENNAWTYRWDVEQNMPDLIKLMGGYKAFERALDEMFSKPLPIDKHPFLSKIGPDHTGIVGNYSIANEPAFRQLYLYNSALTPWKTQKIVRHMIDTWFRNDNMGLPGDEDGGAMSAFVVFSQLGFFPTNICYPYYDFGSPYFDKAVITKEDGSKLTILAKGTSSKNKYVNSMKIDSKPYNKTHISHSDLMKAKTIEFEMSDTPNYLRGISEKGLPEYFKKSS